MPAFVRPSAMSAMTSRSRGVSVSSGSLRRESSSRDDLRVEHRAALGSRARTASSSSSSEATRSFSR